MEMAYKIYSSFDYYKTQMKKGTIVLGLEMATE
jgi:hypothetical protein